MKMSCRVTRGGWRASLASWFHASAAPLAHAAVLIVLSEIPGVAQAPRSAVVTGVVQDQSGAVLPDTAVELIDPSGKVEQTTKADAAGTFRFEHVPAGLHTLRATFPGFDPTSAEVSVGRRDPAPRTLVLRLASVTQEITVDAGTGGRTTGVADNRDAIVVDPNTLATLPVFDRDLVGSLSRFLDPASGAVTLVVDGMEARKIGVSPSAIQQIKLNQDPYAAEYARPGRGRVEVITKAGADAYRGAFDFTFRDARLNSRDVFAATRPPEQRRIYEGFLSGPVRSGKTTSFMGTVERQEEDLQSFVYAFGPAGLIRANVPRPSRSTEVSATLNHQRGTNNISLRFTHEDDTSRNQGVGGTVLPEVVSTDRSREDALIYGHRTVFGKKLLHEFRLLLGAQRQTTESLKPDRQIVVVDAFTSGGAQSDYEEHEQRFTLTDTLTWSSGKHLIKGGLNIPDWSVRRFEDRTNVGGTFWFSTLDDYRLGRPFAFTQQRGDGHLVFLQKVLGAFVQDSVTVRPGLTVTLGLRYDWQNYLPDNNNFAPRASFAFAPRGSGKTVVRGGAGVFYDRMGVGTIAELLHSSHGLLLQYVMVDPGYPDPFIGGSSAATPPPSLVRLSPDVTMPYTVQYTVGIERQLRPKTTMSINYIGSRGVRLFRSRDLNAPPPPLYTARADPASGQIRQIESAGRMRGNSIQFTLRGDIAPFFSGTAQYTLAQTNNDTNGIGFVPANSYDVSSEWGRASFDQRHRFDLMGRIQAGPLFELGVSLSLYSGRPYSLLIGQDVFHTGQTNARPPGVPRNSLEGPGYASLDLRWSKDLYFVKSKKDEGPTVTVGVDAFNVLNRTNRSSYVGNLSSPFFGRALAARPRRRVQLSMGFNF